VKKGENLSEDGAIEIQNIKYGMNKGRKICLISI
jgi:hypothetical protein